MFVIKESSRGEMTRANPIDTNVNDKSPKFTNFGLLYSNICKYKKKILQEEICPIPYTLILISLHRKRAYFFEL